MAHLQFESDVVGAEQQLFLIIAIPSVLALHMDVLARRPKL
jgi:hypothetical protein